MKILPPHGTRFLWLLAVLNGACCSSVATCSKKEKKKKAADVWYNSDTLRRDTPQPQHEIHGSSGWRGSHCIVFRSFSLAGPATGLAPSRFARNHQMFISDSPFQPSSPGIYECTQCSFRYDPAQSGQGALAGTAFEDLPSTWLCPVCKSPKDTFLAEVKTIAGFEDNLKYGFGTNNMTGSQKNFLIFGSLAAFFVLFLAGYALD